MIDGELVPIENLADVPFAARRREDAQPSPARTWLVLWHLLSLDAPSVAAVWTVFLARSAGCALPRSLPAAMFVAVWMLYVADRLLDGRRLPGGEAQQPSCVTWSGANRAGLEARHLFHHRHRTAFLVGLGVAAVVLAGLLPRMDAATLQREVVIGCLLVAYFVLIHAGRGAHRVPKELCVGLFFAAAVAVPTIARLAKPGPRLLLLDLLLAALCTLNCLWIFRWEHPGRRNHRPLSRWRVRMEPPPHPFTRAALGGVAPLSLSLVLVSTVAAGLLREVAPLAIAAAAALLLWLDHRRETLAPAALRAAADLVLLTPLPFFLLRAAR